MPDFGEFADKAEQFAKDHPDQVDEGMQRAGDELNQQTGGRFGNQIQEGEQRAEGYIGGQGQGGQGQGGSGQDQSGSGQGQGGQGQGGYGQDQGQDQGGYGDQGGYQNQ